MSKSYRRHRNPKGKDKEQTTFFGKSKLTQKGHPKSDGAFFQTKLNIGKPGDKYEKEADSVADKVVNQSNPSAEVSRKEISSIQRATLASPVEYERLGTAEQRVEEDKLIQEQSEEQEQEAPQAEQEEETMPVQAKTDDEKKEGEIQQMSDAPKEEPELQPKCDACEEEGKGNIQRKSQTSTPQTSPNTTQQIKDSQGKGKPLPPKVRAEMEVALGTDFKDVTIHVNQDAIALNCKLRAQAFTHGKDIYFNSGKFHPESAAGKRLLAHELTHVVQQSKEGDLVQKQQQGTQSFQFQITPQLQWAIQVLGMRPRRESHTWACLLAAPEYDRPRILMNYLIGYSGNSAYQQIEGQKPADVDIYQYIESIGQFLWNNIRTAFLANANHRLSTNQGFRQQVADARRQGCGQVPFTSRGNMRGV